MVRMLFAVVGLTAVVAGCASSTPPKGLTSGQRQTDRGAFGQAAGAEPAAGLGAPAGPPEVVLYEAKSGGVRGVVVAAWSDGTVVFAPRADEPGRDLRIGRTDSERVSRVIEGCVSNGLGAATLAVAPGGISAPYRSLGIRSPRAQSKSKAWSLSTGPNGASEAMSVCGPCAEQAVGLIPRDGGQAFVQNQAWLDLMERFAHTGRWADDETMR